MSQPRNISDQAVGMGGIAVLVFLFAVLLLAIVTAMAGWTSAGDAQMSIHGWIALGLGTFFSLAIGCGLMALMFYSSRSGYDDAVLVRIKEPNGADDGRK
jgi:hypothetical protein